MNPQSINLVCLKRFLNYRGSAHTFMSSASSSSSPPNKDELIDLISSFLDSVQNIDSRHPLYPFINQNSFKEFANNLVTLQNSFDSMDSSLVEIF